MNRRQRRVLTIALLLGAIVVLFPPWSGQTSEEGYRDPETGKVVIPSAYDPLRRAYIGADWQRVKKHYRVTTNRGSFIFDPPSGSVVPTMAIEWSIDYRRLLIELAVIGVPTLALLALLKDRRKIRRSVPADADD